MDGLNGSSPYGASNAHGGPKLAQKISQTFRYYLDKTTPHYVARWLGLLAFLMIYGIRVYYLKGTCNPFVSLHCLQLVLVRLSRLVYGCLCLCCKNACTNFLAVSLAELVPGLETYPASTSM
jgi:hypothetical protein